MGDSKQFLKNKDTLTVRVTSGLLSDITSQVNPTLSKARTAIDSLTVVLGSVNRLFDPSTKNNVQGIIANLLVSSANLQKLLNTETGLLAKTIGNLNEVTSNLKTNNDTINSILHNVNSTTQHLADLSFKQTMICELEATSLFGFNSCRLCIAFNPKGVAALSRFKRLAEKFIMI